VIALEKVVLIQMMFHCKCDGDVDVEGSGDGDVFGCGRGDGYGFMMNEFFYSRDDIDLFDSDDRNEGCI